MAHFLVHLRNRTTGEEQSRLVITDDERKAGEVAIWGAKNALQTMSDRQYTQFDVLAVSEIEAG
jgi:hypothetical protein